MLISDFTALMEEIAPAALKMEGDNIGLLVGTTRKAINKVLIALDCTPEVVQEAAALEAGLILTHHPLFFQSVNCLLPDDAKTAVAFLLARHNIALFAAHTNLDAAAGGVNDALADLLSLENVSPLAPDNLGRIGNIESTSLLDFALRVQNRLNTAVCITGNENAPIKTVALVGGSGGSCIANAKNAGADALLTGEVRHHEALEAKRTGLNLIVAGHFETESVVLLPLLNRLQALSKDVQYYLAQSEMPCLRRIEPRGATHE